MTLRPARLFAASLAGLSLLLAASPVLASHSHAVAKAHSKSSRHSRFHAAPAVAKWHPGQLEIDPDRTRSIQQALISKSYLTGEPSGEWDAETAAAMQKFQNDNGWQTKLMPDSRALIKLGLGPNGANAAAATPAAGTLQQSTGSDSLASAHSIVN